MEVEGSDRGLLVGLSAFRWGAWAWMAVLAVASRDDLVRPGIAVGSILASLAVTIGLTVALRVDPAALLRPPALVIEVAVGAWMFVADGWAYGGNPAGVTAPPALGSVWTVTGVIAVGVALGPRWGGAAGALLGVANVVGKSIAGDPGLVDQTLGMASTAVQHVLAGAGIGYAASKVRTTERSLVAAEARAEVARTLHDGVLQTLAVIQRRTDSAADLVRLARDQERELREFLFGQGVAAGGGDLGTRLRERAATYEHRFGGVASVVAVDEDLLDVRDERVVAALAGAVGEALTNAGKHAGGPAVTVYVEADDAEVFCSVKDAGPGYDPADRPDGQGLQQSIRGRIDAAGGRVEVDARAGRGVEVRMWVPRRMRASR